MFSDGTYYDHVSIDSSGNLGVMNYTCPKCRSDIRWRYKGLMRLNCPVCKVSLYRTQSAAEVEFSRLGEFYALVLVAVALVLVGAIYLLLRGSELLWPSVTISIFVLLGLAYRAFWPSPQHDWPRWTDRKPW